MLILTRKPGEKIMISPRKPGETVTITDAITVTVVKVNGLAVRVGIEAPPTLSVDREEVYLKKQAQRGQRP